MPVLKHFAASRTRRALRTALESSAAALGAAFLTMLVGCADAPVAPAVNAPDARAITITGPNTFTDLGVGVVHNCAVRYDGKAECWGANMQNQAPATRAAASGAFTQVTSGRYHSCALRTDGAYECWGNAAGTEYLPAIGRASDTSAFVAVEAGGYNVCALRRSDGAIECAGFQTAGESPALKVASTGGRFTKLAVGGDHGCALESVRGDIECWGDNSDGAAPVLRSGPFIDVGAGLDYSCGVHADGSALVCWGRGEDTVLTASASSFKSVAVGTMHICALRADGKAQCFGQNPYGAAPALQQATQGEFVQLQVGDRHSCGRTTYHTVECWGDNAWGQAPASRTASDLWRHVYPPSATFTAPDTVMLGDPIELALTDATVANYMGDFSFTYAFDCGRGVYGLSDTTSTTRCRSEAAGIVTVRGKVIDQDGDEAEYVKDVVILASVASPPPPATPAQQLQTLSASVRSTSLSPNIRTGLISKLDAAMASLAAGQRPSTCQQLQAFVNTVTAQRGKAISDSDASAWLAVVTALRRDLGC